MPTKYHQTVVARRRFGMFMKKKTKRNLFRSTLFNGVETLLFQQDMALVISPLNHIVWIKFHSNRKLKSPKEYSEKWIEQQQKTPL